MCFGVNCSLPTALSAFLESKAETLIVYENARAPCYDMLSPTAARMAADLSPP